MKAKGRTPPLLPTAVAGDRYAQYHAEFANAGCVQFERLLPPDNLDWNDVLKKGKGSETCSCFRSVAITAAGVS